MSGGLNQDIIAGPVRDLDIGPSLSASWLRGGTFAVAALLGLPLWDNTPLVVIPLALFAASVLVPMVLLPLTSLLLLVGSYAALVPPGSWAVFPYAAGIHLLFVMFAFLLGIPRRTDVSTAVLRRVLLRVGRIQLLVQPTAAVALFVQDSGTQPALVAVACAGFAAWAFWLVRILRRK
ncbi:hypothetical protein GCM10027403_05170 [Arthrobacter tecti]